MSTKKFKRWVTSEVLPSIRKTGEYKSNPASVDKQITPAEMVLEVGKMRDAIKSVFGTDAVKEGIALEKSIDMVGKHYKTDLSALKAFLPPATHNVGHLTPSMLGNAIGASAKKINKCLEMKGLQYKDAKGNWILTDTGKAHGDMVPFTSKYGGHSGYYILWNNSVLNFLLENHLPF